MWGGRRDVRELECLLELRARPRAVSQVQERFAQAHSGQRLAPDRPELSAEPRRVEQVRAGRLEVSREQLGLAEHGRGERLSAPRTCLLRLRTQPLGKAGEALVRITGGEDVLG